MSGRQSSTGTKFSVQSGDLPVGTAISAGTKAKPSVLTVAAAPAGLVTGEAVVVRASGWKSLDNRPFTADPVAGTSITLKESDTNGEPKGALAGATVAEIPFSESCMATLVFNSPAGNVIDQTTLCDEARVTTSGMPAIATWQATGFWDATDAVQTRLHELYSSGEYVAFRCEFPDGSGLMFNANVNSFDVRAGVDQAVAIAVGGAMSGKVTRFGVADADTLSLMALPEYLPETLDGGAAARREGDDRGPDTRRPTPPPPDRDTPRGSPPVHQPEPRPTARV
jgi:hypothetical protein